MGAGGGGGKEGGGGGGGGRGGGGGGRVAEASVCSGVSRTDKKCVQEVRMPEGAAYLQRRTNANKDSLALKAAAPPLERDLPPPVLPAVADASRLRGSSAAERRLAERLRPACASALLSWMQTAEDASSSSSHVHTHTHTSTSTFSPPASLQAAAPRAPRPQVAAAGRACVFLFVVTKKKKS